MGRSLYINQTTKPRINRDGPSIWIQEEGKAGRRIPARLITRAVIIGNVRFDSETIMLFADHNIPVTFMNNRTEEAAVVIPYNHRLPDHYKEQKTILDSDENINHYVEWANSKRTLLQLNLIKRFLPRLAGRLERTGFGEGNYQLLLKKMRRAEEEQWLLVNNMVTGIFRNLIIEYVIKAELDPHVGIIHRRHNFGFALDLCYIMGGESDLQSVQFFRSKGIKSLITKKRGQWIITEQGIRNIIHRFENKRKDIERKIENILDEFFELMREIRT
jgi:CRISPR/Cas system-associated endonuclease Cas1